MKVKQKNLNKPCLISCNECKLYTKYCNGLKNIKYSSEGIYVLKRQLPKILNTIDRFENLETVTIKTPFNGTFPKFIPQIGLNDKRTFYWLFDPSLKETFNTIMIRFDHIGTIKNLANKLIKYRFPKKIIISTVMPDNKLDALNPSIYVTKLNAINRIMSKQGYMLIATTIDTYTYIDDPPLLSWSKTMESIIKAHKLANSKIPLIGIVKGADKKQIELSINKLSEMGFKCLAFTCRELMEQKNYNLLKFTVNKIHAASSKCLLIGFNSLRLLTRIPFIDYFSGLNWFRSAIYGRIYLGLKRKKNNLKNLRFKVRRTEKIAVQNLRAIKLLLESFEKQTLVENFCFRGDMNWAVQDIVQNN